MTLAPTPLDMAQALRQTDWRQRLVCPVTPPALRGALRRSTQGYLKFLSSVPNDKDRAIANLAASLISPKSITLIEAAFIAQAEMNGFPRLPGRIPEVDYLTSGNDKLLLGPLWSALAPKSPSITPLAGLRRLKAPLNWAPLWRLSQCVFSSQSVISFSSHLVSEMMREGRAAASNDANHLLALARQGSHVSTTLIPNTMAKAACAAVTDIDELEPEVLRRLENLITPIAVAALQHAANDLADLRQFNGLPQGVLAGSGGPYSSRAVGLEVMQRGGTVERFEHGGPLGMMASFEGMMLCDLTVSSRYMMMSARKIELFKNLDPAKLFPDLDKVDMRYSGGDRHFEIAPRSARSSTGKNRKVLYGPTKLRGHQQHEQPLLMDLVYLDWQIRLVEELGRHPADVILKPHPQTPSDDWRQLFTGLCEITDIQFESLIPETDVIVCDYPQTTIFWAALCSDRPVVLLDLGISPFNPALAQVFARRCTIVKASYDHNGLPQVSADALHEAIHGAPEAADPSEIKRFFLAE